MRKEINTRLILVSLIVIILYIVSNQVYFRLDLSEDRQYTLSKATKQILRDIDEPITIKAYFSDKLPPNVLKIKNDFKNILIEYSNLSNNIVYKFINPNEDPNLEKQAFEDGVMPVMISIRDKDQMKQQKAFLGAVLFYGEKKEAIPVIGQGASMEYSLSSSIKKLTIKDKVSVGIIKGHGEPSKDNISQITKSMEILYDVKDVDLKDSIADDIKTLVIIAPTDSISTEEFSNLDDFLSKEGKGLLVAINKVTADPNKGMGSVSNTGLSEWLKDKGIDINTDFIVDAQCANVTVTQQQAGFQFSSQIPFPFIPVVTNFSQDSPITKGLEQVIMEYVSSISYRLDSSKQDIIKINPIAFSSDKSSSIKSPTVVNIQKQWTKEDFKEEPLTVALTVEGNILGNKSSRMVVFGDGDFALSKNRGQLPPDNVNLFTNSIDWLSDQTGLMDLRTKGVTSRPIDKLEESTKIFLKYINFILPILVIVLYGFIRKHKRLSLRLKRKNESYVR